MRVVLAPDKFAGTLSAAQAAAALAEGWASVRPGDDLVLAPMADGGEGTIDVVAAAVRWTRRCTTVVADARGTAVAADWLLLPDGTALIEAAQACGLTRLDPGSRNPRLTTSYGVGQLIIAAVGEGASAITVGVGGTATVDGGAGMAIALGHRLLRADGNGVKVGGEYNALLSEIEPVARPPVPLVAACDVRAPLLGEQGAVAVYAPQKGAEGDDLDVLEAALSNLADVTERDVEGGPWRDLPGAGAGGGLGFGLAAFAGARTEGGAAMVARLVGLEEALEGADAVVTGEGRLDATSLDGKVTGWLVDRAAESGASILAVVGQVSGAVPDSFSAVAPLGPEGFDEPAKAVAERAAELARRR